MNKIKFKARTVHRDRPTVLIGWNAGAVLALRAALEAPVHACVCFAFANLTIDGLRCDIDDDFYDLTCPVLFVVGQFSSTCDINTLQDFRSGCKAITGLLVVGGADDELRMGSEKLQMEALTQSMVDRCILVSKGGRRRGRIVESYLHLSIFKRRFQKFD